MLALIPGLLVPLLAVRGGQASLTASPNPAAPGATITVTGATFPAHTRGALVLDGAATGVDYRVDSRGSFSASIRLASTAAVGQHEIGAMSEEKRNSTHPTTGKARARAAGVLVATVIISVATSSPTSAPRVGPSRAPAATSPSSSARATGSPTGTQPSSTAPAGVAVGGANWQPSLPVRASFYYPWFPEGWNQQGLNPFTRYHPSLGYYDGSAASVIDRHIAAMQYANISVGIASWWGQGTRTDSRLPALLAQARDKAFRWSVYYELEGESNPSVTQVAADLSYIKNHYAADAGYYRINGRFVVFVYGGASDSCATADRWRQAAAASGAYVVLKVFSGYRTCASQPDAWHQYAPAVGVDSQAGYSFSVSPGFFKANEPSARLARNLAQWSTNVHAMVASGAPFQLVTTFNEWGEGTSVESATEWASSSGFGAYLDVLHASGQSSQGGSTGAVATPRPPAPTPPPPAPTPPPPAATPPPPAAGAAVLVGAGDIASSGSGDSATAALLSGIPGTVFNLGDNCYDVGTLACFNSYYQPTWGAAKSRTLPTIGNHEGESAGSGQGYCAYFGPAAHCNANGTQDGAGYYSYNVGSWHVIVLNSNCGVTPCGVGSAQYNWLVADLQAHASGCTLAMWHHPRFSSGDHGDDARTAAFWQALYAYNADVVLNGHDHDYERFAPQTPTAGADASRGIREFVVGTGGRSHYAFATARANSEVRNADTFGVLKLTLSTGSYSWKFVPEAGKSFTDSGSTPCH